MKLLRIAVSLIFVVLLASCACPPAEPEVVVVTQEVIKEGETVVVTQEVVKEVVKEVEVEKEGPIEIAVIVKTSNSSFWQNVQTGAFVA
jgi:hypothetical protein